MKRPGRKCFYAFIAAALTYITVDGVTGQLTKGSTYLEFAENKQWIGTSEYWLDRQVCYWLGVCGAQHLVRKGRWTWPEPDDRAEAQVADHSGFWTSGVDDPTSWSQEEVKRRTIPQYVLDHAPYVHLYSGENFWPCDIAEHLVHTSPRLNYSLIEEMQSNRNLTNLDELNDYEGGRNGRYIYLQSDDNVEERPHWLGGNKNIPTAPEAMADAVQDAPWPGLDDLRQYNLEGAKQQALKDYFREREQHEHDDGDDEEEEDDQEKQEKEVPNNFPWNLEKSLDGTCGGSSGYTCEGSGFGECCSMFGFCGNSNAHCGSTCDPLSGNCATLGIPLKTKPHRELRRRSKDFLKGEKNIPSAVGKSSAPAVLIVVPKENGVVDAFWFFFYSYNLGNTVFGVRFGNHVGDWEHTVIRFKHGKPKTVFMSEHNFGEAYAWHAIEKYIPDPDGSGTMMGSWTNVTINNFAKRPVVYSASGSHAMYGTPGLHPYVLPWGLLHDRTDRGPLWDPLLNSHSFMYDLDDKTIRASTHTPRAPVNWFYYTGHWGDKYYPLSDPRQYRFAGQYHYVNGPLGPRFKHLGRDTVCQGKGDCHIKHWNEDSDTDRLPPEEDIEEGGLPGGNITEQVR